MNSLEETGTLPAADIALTAQSSRAGRLAWTQAVLASCLMLATLPGRTQGLGLITEPLLADLQLDRLVYANLNLWATLLGALGCFVAGWAIDRFGLRWVTALLTFLLGVTVWQVSAFSGGLVLFFLLLLATRALGQSALSVCSLTTVGRWFPGQSGLAMGVYSTLLSVLFALAFVVIGNSVGVNGWRTAWLQVALALVFGITPLVLLVLREPQPNSRDSQSGSVLPPLGEQPTSTGVSLGQALRMRAFWVFAGAGASFNLVSSGLGLFNQAVLAERGFDQKTFTHFLALSTLMSLVGQFGCGWLSKRLQFGTLTMAGLVLYAVGLAGIPVVQSHWQLWIVAILLGVSGGFIIVVFFAVWSDVFGQRQLGRIQGVAQMLTVLSSGLGPVLFAKCSEVYHTYTPLLLVLAGAVLLLALFAKTARTNS